MLYKANALLELLHIYYRSFQAMQVYMNDKLHKYMFSARSYPLLLIEGITPKAYPILRNGINYLAVLP
mgnify:CR=1 FL=1